MLIRIRDQAEAYRTSVNIDASFLIQKHHSLLALSHRQPETGTAHSVVNAAKQLLLAKKINSDRGQKVASQKPEKSPGWKGHPEEPGELIPHLLVDFLTGRGACSIRNAALGIKEAPQYIQTACYSSISKLVSEEGKPHC